MSSALSVVSNAFLLSAQLSFATLCYLDQSSGYRFSATMRCGEAKRSVLSSRPRPCNSNAACGVAVLRWRARENARRRAALPWSTRTASGCAQAQLFAFKQSVYAVGKEFQVLYYEARFKVFEQTSRNQQRLNLTPVEPKSVNS